MTERNFKFKVNSEVGTLRKLIIHSPDGGIGKIIPSTFKDNLYDDIVHLKRMQKEYNHYVKLLLYFLDPEKIKYIKDYENDPANNDKKGYCYIPGRPEYFNSDKVIEIQHMLHKVLEDEYVRHELITAICATEGVSYAIQQRLEGITDTRVLAKIIITGILPAKENNRGEDQYIFPPIPNFIFTRDIGIMLNDHLLISKMGSKARRRESMITKFIALYYFFKEDTSRVIEIMEESNFFLYEEDEQLQHLITIEGGDVMMIHPRHLLVGCSERTSPNAVNEIIHHIFSRPYLDIEKISVIKIPKKRAHMHIDTIFTQVKRNVWVMFGYYSERLQQEENRKRMSYVTRLMHTPDIIELEELEVIQFYKPRHEAYQANKDYGNVENPRGLEELLKQVSMEDFGVPEEEVRIIYSGNNQFPYDDREQWTDSCNLLALKEGVVVGYDRNDETTKAFMENGFEVITTDEAFKRFENGVDPQSLENTLILLPSAELSRARGGSHCMSMPLLRDDIV